MAKRTMGMPVAGRGKGGAGDAIDLSPLTGQVGYVLRRAQLAVFDDFIRAFAKHDIRPGEYSVLVAIQRNPDARQGAIAAALAIQRSNFVALIDALERRGLVARNPGNGDRRAHALRLTAPGTRLLVRLQALCAEHERRVGDAIGSKAARTALIAALRRLAGLDTGNDALP